MPKPRNKAHHLAAAASATKVVNDARRRQCINVVLAVRAGATWSEVAEATGLSSKQMAHYTFHRYDTDGEHLWQQPTLPKGARKRPLRAT